MRPDHENKLLGKTLCELAPLVAAAVAALDKPGTRALRRKLDGAFHFAAGIYNVMQRDLSPTGATTERRTVDTFGVLDAVMQRWARVHKRSATPDKGVVMGRHYGQLSLDERHAIAQLCKAGQSIRKIAADLDRAPSTVSRELKRNHGAQVGYKPGYAHEQARARRWTGPRLKHDAELRGLVLGQLRRGWSPEQIAGRLRQQNAATTISHGSGPA